MFGAPLIHEAGAVRCNRKSQSSDTGMCFVFESERVVGDKSTGIFLIYFFAPLPPFSVSSSRGRDPQFLTSLYTKTLFQTFVSARGGRCVVTFESSGLCSLSGERRFGRASKNMLLWWKDPRKVSSFEKSTDSSRGKVPKQSENCPAKKVPKCLKKRRKSLPPSPPPLYACDDYFMTT